MAGTEAPRAGEGCPGCGASLVSERQAAAWCSACEWNLPVYEPNRRRPEIGWRWLDRSTHRAAYRLTRRQFVALNGKEIARTGPGAASITMVAVGVAFVVAILAALLGGGYLAVTQWPHPIAFGGLLLVLVAVAARPRLGKLDKRAERLQRVQAPTLFAVIDRVAAELGAPRPDVILVDAEFNASCSTVGLRRRRVLCLGLPLWTALPPQQRLALIAHELGHLVNGDPRRGVVSGIPVNTLNVLTDLTRPDSDSYGAIAAIASLLMGILHGSLTCVRLALLWIWLRTCHRAEYLADEMAARVAGSAATVGLLDRLLSSAGMPVAVTVAAARSGEAGQARAVAELSRQDPPGRVAALRQLSVRDEASMFATHPPLGLRARLIEARRQVGATLTLTEPESERLDQELASWYDRASRGLI